MSRTNLALTLAAVAVTAGVAGCAVGFIFAPASGKELRRRLAWRTEDQWRSVARASGRMLERAAVRARREVRSRGARVAEAMAAKTG